MNHFLLIKGGVGRGCERVSRGGTFLRALIANVNLCKSEWKECSTEKG